MSFELTVRGPIAPADVPGLCTRVHTLLSGADERLDNGDLLPYRDADVVCDVSAVGEPDLATVDALARMQLTAALLGHRMVLRDAAPELRQLLDLAGLADVLPSLPGQDGGVAGRPKSGKRVSVSRKNANSTIRPSDTSSTWSAHGS